MIERDRINHTIAKQILDGFVDPLHAFNYTHPDLFSRTREAFNGSVWNLATVQRLIRQIETKLSKNDLLWECAKTWFEDKSEVCWL